ncbi:helix-turn-helix domain-containing protein [Chromobacterium piscinae]|uniref:Helix-turn-helix domain-containing protein n=2 Tax=Chromobacterium piscinae TaxID=686831 RepID=A0ABV0H727_9NEIS|nr:helix-turn-helix domain-containing protein [Chromobacterium piscinae]MCD5327828.1 helix-turn-helix domain-containing protein [Chromobacterium piscinae]
MTDLPPIAQLDPNIAALLAQLWRAASSGGQPWSLARLAKQSGLGMSTLLRCLHQLAELELARMEIQDNGRGRAWLSEEGLACCREWFDASGQN